MRLPFRVTLSVRARLLLGVGAMLLPLVHGWLGLWPGYGVQYLSHPGKDGWPIPLAEVAFSPEMASTEDVEALFVLLERPDPVCSRKLLLQRGEINKLIGLTERAGYTLVPTAMYWKRGRAKLEIGLARGKKQYDKRDSEKDRDWGREKERLFKRH